jgi:hypothetical protein
MSTATEDVRAIDMPTSKKMKLGELSKEQRIQEVREILFEIDL